MSLSYYYPASFSRYLSKPASYGQVKRRLLCSLAVPLEYHPGGTLEDALRNNRVCFELRKASSHIFNKIRSCRKLMETMQFLDERWLQV